MAKDEQPEEPKKDEKQAETKEQKPEVKKAGKAKGKKRWVPIVAPKSFDNITLGETYVEEAPLASGKTIVANLMNLTGDMRRQGIEIRFDIVKVHDGKALCAATGFELTPSTLKRMIRRGRAKISDSFTAKTATGRYVRIKPVVITANPASKGACTAIRLHAREKLKQIVAGASFDKLLQDLIEYKVQRVVRDDVNKHHPVKNVEIKSCVLLPEGTSERREVREDSREEDFVTVRPPAPEEKPAEQLAPQESEDASEKPDADSVAEEEESEKASE